MDVFCFSSSVFIGPVNILTGPKMKKKKNQHILRHLYAEENIILLKYIYLSISIFIYIFEGFFYLQLFQYNNTIISK